MSFKTSFFGRLWLKMVALWDKEEPKIETALAPAWNQVVALTAKEFNILSAAALNAMKTAGEGGVGFEGLLDVGYDAIKAALPAIEKTFEHNFSAAAVNLLATIFGTHLDQAATGSVGTVQAAAQNEATTIIDPAKAPAPGTAASIVGSA